MKAVILCAGKGTRLSEITNNISKVMVDIHGKPLLLHQIEHIKQFGITNIFINLYHLPDSIVDYFKDGKKFGVHITYSKEERLLGTSGALQGFLSDLNERFLLLYGDVLTKVNIANVEKFHIKKQAAVTAIVRKTDHAYDSDLALFTSEKRLRTIQMKPHKKTIKKSLYQFAAIYLMEPTVLKDLPKKTPSDTVKDFIPKLLKKNTPIFCYNTHEFVMDIGTTDRLEKAKQLFYP